MDVALRALHLGERLHRQSQSRGAFDFMWWYGASSSASRRPYEASAFNEIEVL